MIRVEYVEYFYLVDDFIFVGEFGDDVVDDVGRFGCCVWWVFVGKIFELLGFC